MKTSLTILFLLITTLTFTQKDSIHPNRIQLEIKDGKDIFQSKKSDWWDKYSSGLIAMITVFTSLGISVYVSKKNQKQTRSNSISGARISWIQDLRPLLGKLILETSQLANNYKELEKFIDKDNLQLKPNLSQFENQELKNIAKNNSQVQEEFDNTFSQIKLFLNRKEKEHQELLDAIINFIENVKKEVREKEYKNNLNTEDLITKAQTVLKNAWEQAKNEGK